MSLAEGWYAVAVADDIEPGTSAGTRLFDQELVVWRDLAGVSHVWEDRCPHRGMRLSFGFVRGNHIACLYHGWAYDTAGQCRAIPAHPDLAVPETIKVATYHAAEAAGLIFVHSALGAEAPPPPAPVPSGRALRSLYVDLPLRSVAAELSKGFTRQDDGSYAGTLAGVPVLIFLQPFTASRTALHLVLAGPGDAVAVSAAGEALRNSFEAAPHSVLEAAE
ncbi:Rieske [2Fe-2S] domain-containing protein [Kaistia soli DSM 19436]|uniref:Rieske [2Fe-2S] domain-containing protein n=1 Tax=Kaistia soli DSM 19436 TaxID=1122133 RepID=A0A1M5D6G5_9HYPH|nr:Rieske (2Fe-2S) protein [Kaistia soli]SHF62551.1 Rieske [2Fe-2S] domain-containing protein [Kaistia soli DSM 19436]